MTTKTPSGKQPAAKPDAREDETEPRTELPGQIKCRTCFVIMPISDPDGYEPGHFARVYEHLIRPACIAEGIETSRADDNKSSDLIIVDILRRVVESDLVVCDLSAKNPNVMYELGIRQAFDKPTVLVKDRRTPHVFDTSGLRTLEYDEKLRIDMVRRDLEDLKQALRETLSHTPEHVNSMIRLLSIPAAKAPQPVEMSNEAVVILDAVRAMESRFSRIEQLLPSPNVMLHSGWSSQESSRERASAGRNYLRKQILVGHGVDLQALVNAMALRQGDMVWTADGVCLGRLDLLDVEGGRLTIKDDTGKRMEITSAEWQNLFVRRAWEPPGQ